MPASSRRSGMRATQPPKAVLFIALALAACTSSLSDPALKAIEPPRLGSAPSPRLANFAAPAAEPDLAKLAAPARGATFTPVALDEMLANGPKGAVLMQLKPVAPPPGLESASKGIELRRAKNENPSTLYHGFAATARLPQGPTTLLLAFTALTNRDGRLAACGFFFADRTQKALTQVPDRFLDPRSYLDIGGLARLPTIYFSDATPFLQIGMPEQPMSLVQDPTLAKRVVATCGVSNIAWDDRFATASLSLHLQDPPLKFEWTSKETYHRPETPPAVPAPKPTAK